MQKEDTAQKPTDKNKTAPAPKPNNTPPKTKIDYVEMAKERNARVILHNTPDTYPLTDMARYADQGIRRLRNRILISIAPKEALPLLKEYNEALVKLDSIIGRICAITNVRYRTPRALEQILNEISSESANESTEEKSLSDN